MSTDTPNPDALADFLIDAAAGAGGDAVGRRDAVKAEILGWHSMANGGDVPFLQCYLGWSDVAGHC